MKKIILGFLLLALGLMAQAQNISVKSFRLLETDMDAGSLTGKRIDQNNEVCALIKIVTTQTGFTFEAGALGVVDTKQEAGEVWVWVPRGSRKITIKHPQLGVLREYRYPIEIQAERTYEMVLITGTVETIVKEQVRQQYLMFQITPADAILEVDDQVWKVSNEGTSRKLVDFGNYKYRVQAPNYHPEAGQVTVDDPTGTKKIVVTLQPNFGWIEVPNGAGLDGASVYVDNALIGKVPCKSEPLKSGQHNLKIVKELYDTFNQVVTVNDNETTRVTPTLTANFAHVTLQVDADAEIWVNDERKGVRSWSGDLENGSYKVECKMENHEPTVARKEITSQLSGEVIRLDAPCPIYGSLAVESTPDMAELFIDGKSYGETPSLIPEILIGKHELRFVKSGYAEHTETITIAKGERKQVQVTLDDKDYDKIAKQGNDYFDAKNYEEALKCYREAAEHGNAVGQNGMGRLYVSGNVVKQDDAEGVRWYRMAAEQGYAGAQCNLGNMYELGRGVTQDYAEAVKWYQKAAKQGHANGQCCLGWMYDKGKGVTQDYAEALKWYRLSAEQGNSDAQCILGIMYRKGEGVTQDYAEALKWFRLAAEQNDAQAQCNLGYMYDNGIGVTQDYAEALKWYRKAAEQGSALGQACLGEMYYTGHGVTQNYSEAVKWYQKAADQGYAKAQCSLGYMYTKGYGVTADDSEAVKWYRKSAEQGYPVAQYNLGVHYENGDGVRKSKKEAKEWYQKAAAQGYENAQKALQRLK